MLLQMCVNTEWGGFSDDGSLDSMRTKFDSALDEKTINPGRQRFEKMISGMYLGELVRVTMEALARDGLLFNGDYDAIAQRGCFPTKYVSEIEAEMQEDSENQFNKTQQILEEIGISTVTPIDCSNVAYICSAVSTRAAYLCAAGTACVLRRVAKPYVTIGVDGSVYRFHPTFPALLEQKTEELLQGEKLEVSSVLHMRARASKPQFFVLFFSFNLCSRKMAVDEAQHSLVSKSARTLFACY